MAFIVSQAQSYHDQNYLGMNIDISQISCLGMNINIIIWPFGQECQREIGI